VSLTRDATTRIRDAIVSGRLGFGEALSESQLAAALGMSKAPVRAALIELREKGLVTIAPQAGSFVCSPSADDIIRLSSFRCLIETEGMQCALREHADLMVSELATAVGRMAASRKSQDGSGYIAADTAYHFTFIKLSDNRFLEQAYDLVSGIVEALRVRLFNAGQSFRQKSFADHVAILKCLQSADFPTAARILNDHIMRTRQLLEVVPSPQPPKSRRVNKTHEQYRELFRTDAKRWL